MWPLATPPMAGLQLICATVSRFVVSRATPSAHSRGGQRRLGARVPGAHDEHIVFIGTRGHVVAVFARARASRKPRLRMSRNIGEKSSYFA